jgi:hypothetical protein
MIEVNGDFENRCLLWYNDDNNGTIYGKQYNWYAVMGINTVESATPTTEDTREKN